MRGSGSWALVNAADRQVLNTLVPFQAQKVVARVNPGFLVTGAPQARFQLRGPLMPEPVIGLFAPDLLPRPKYNVAVAFKASVVQAMVQRLAVPSGGIAAVLDQRHVVVARSRDPQKWVGTSPTGDVKRRASRGQEGFAETVTLDGVASLTYLSAPNRYGWSAVVGLPSDLLASTANRLTVQALTAAGGLLLGGLGLALCASRSISGPLIRLRLAARQLGAGEVPPALRTGVTEADDVAVALHRAGIQAQHSTDELHRQVGEAVEKAQRVQAQLLESQKHEAMGRLTGGLAHDFNNLLQTITTSLQLALRIVPADTGAHKAIQAGVRASGKAAGLIRQMTAFGRADAVVPEQVRVEDWLLRSQDLLHKALAGKAALTFMVDTAVPPLWVDPTQLELAVLNLLFNARDAVGNGGTVRIEARKARTEETKTLSPGDYLCFSVVDTGHGMSPVVLARAVEPYSRPSPRQPDAVWDSRKSWSSSGIRVAPCC